MHYTHGILVLCSQANCFAIPRHLFNYYTPENTHREAWVRPFTICYEHNPALTVQNWVAGVSICNPLDNFSRELGRKYALEEYNTKLDKHSSFTTKSILNTDHSITLYRDTIPYLDLVPSCHTHSKKLCFIEDETHMLRIDKALHEYLWIKIEEDLYFEQQRTIKQSQSSGETGTQQS